MKRNSMGCMVGEGESGPVAVVLLSPPSPPAATMLPLDVRFRGLYRHGVHGVGKRVVVVLRPPPFHPLLSHHARHVSTVSG